MIGTMGKILADAPVVIANVVNKTNVSDMIKGLLDILKVLKTVFLTLSKFWSDPKKEEELKKLKNKDVHVVEPQDPSNGKSRRIEIACGALFSLVVASVFLIR